MRYYFKYLFLITLLFADNEVCFDIEENPIPNEPGFAYFTKYVSVLDCFGIFANGGANIFYTRTEWLRIPIGDHSVREVQRKVSQASYEINAVLGKF